MRLGGAERWARDHRLLPGESAPTRAATIREWAAATQAELVVLEPSEPPLPAVAHTVGDVRPPCLEPLETHYESREALVLELEHGRVVGQEGLVVAADGTVLRDTVWSDELVRLMLPHGRRLPRPRRLEGRVASLVAPWWTNWAHWLFDTLPRLAVLERAGRSELPLLVPAKLSAARRRSLALLGVPDGRIVPYDARHVVADRLVWASTGAMTGYHAPWSARWLRERLVAATGAPHGGERRLYVSRSPTRRVDRGYPRRAVVNEDALLGLLVPLGFEVVRPETLSLDDQVRTFAEAELVVAPHGAGSANVVFSPRLTLVELFAPGFANHGHFALCAACGHDYWYVLGGSAADGDIVAPLDELEETLRRLRV